MLRQFNIPNRCSTSVVLPVLLCWFHIFYASAMEYETVGDLILGENNAVRGQWPFTALLYHVKASQYICGGSLISRKHVLTAAHCMQNKYSENINQPEDVIVSLGLHDLTAADDERVIRANISAIHVHVDWDPYSSRFDADLAILVLSHRITFTEYIRPIRLPADSVDINSATIDVNGTIVGWRFLNNHTNFVNIPRSVSVRAFNDSLCYKVDFVMAKFTSDRTFCGGFGDGISIRNSGSGFFVKSDHEWVQYGIVAAIRTNATNHVTGDSISIYTNVKMFKNWIVETVKDTGGIVGSEEVLPQHQSKNVQLIF